MFDILPDRKTRFNALLVKKAIPEKCHNDYRKWLRYYVDFCRKYHFHESERESLPHFIKKLQVKNQTQEQQKQASHSIALYYELIQSGTKKEIPSPQTLISQRLTKGHENVTLPLAPSHQGRGEY